MSEITEERPPRRPRYRLLRNILVVLGCLALLLALAWLLLEQYIQIDTYRPALEAKIEDATGLPATIGDLDLALRPIPVIHVKGLQLGSGDFALRARHLDLFPDVGELLQKSIRVNRLDLMNLAVVVPRAPSDMKARFQALVEQMRKRKGGSIRFNVDRIVAQGASLYVGGTEKPFFTGDLDLHEVLSSNPFAVVKGHSVAFRDRIDADGRIRIKRATGGDGIEMIRGDFNLDGLNLARLVERRKVPRVVIGVEGQFGGDSPNSIAIALDGKVEPAANAAALGESLEGPFTGRAKWDGSAFHIEELRWDAMGLRLRSDIVVEPDGSYNVSVPRAVIGSLTLNPIFEWETSKSIDIRAEKKGSVEITDLNVRAASPKQVDLLKGRVAFAGIDITGAEDREIANGLSGVVLLDEKVIRIEELKAPNVNAKGTVTPDLEARTAAVDLSGRVELNKAFLGRVISVDRLSTVKGAVELQRVAGTFGAGKGLPEDFVAEGSLKNGEVGFAASDLTDTVSNITATFSTRGESVEIKASGDSSKMGALELAGRYMLDARTWEGTLVADPANAAAPFLKKERAREIVTPLLQPYGRSAFAVTFTFPGEKKPGAVELVRQGDPQLQAKVVLNRKKSGMSAGDIAGSATLPITSASVDPFLPDNARASGTAGVTFARDASAGRFTAHIDLTDVAMDISDYLHKRSGMQAAVNVIGTAGEKWSAEALTADVNGETVQGVWQNDRLMFPAIDLNVAQLTELLPPGSSGSGRISGTVTTGPAHAQLALHDVSFTIKPGAEVQSLNGGVEYGDNRLVLRELNVQGANSQATVTAVRENGVWRGEAVAQQLDVEAVNELRKAALAKPEGETQESEPAANGEKTARAPFTGRFDVRVARLLYRRAEIPDVHAVVEAEGNTIRLNDLSAKPAGGVATGVVAVVRGEASAPWVLQGKLNLKDVGAQIIDELAFKEPRGFEGAISGDVAFTVPVLPEQSPVNAADAEAIVTARNGTFGRLGLATRILNTIRKTEILRLRLPSLRDEGLTYDTAAFNMKMNDGVMQVEKFSLQRPSFAMEAEGVVNFPQDDMRIGIDIHPFQTVTGLVGKVPVVGQMAREIQKAAPLGLVAKGSPFDPSVVPEALSGGGEQTEEMAETGEETPAEEAPATEVAQADANAGEEATAEEAAPAETTAAEGEAVEESQEARANDTETAEEPATDEAGEQTAREERGVVRGVRDAAKGVLGTLRGRPRD